MKAILQSIKPQYCELIAAGKKTIEVRKTKPQIQLPFKCYIYMTKSEDGCYSDWEYPRKQKVIGEYVCDEIVEFTVDEYSDHSYFISDDELAETCLSQEELWDYGKGKILYGWHISNLVIYDKPKELSEFRIIDKEYLTKCPYRSRIYNNPDYTNGALLKGSFVCVDDGEPDFCRGQCKGAKKPLTRPPQSWCYVEGI